MRIAIDVDITTVETDKAWLHWLNTYSGKNLTLKDCNYDYNLGKYFPELDDPFDFWRDKRLYDGIVPRLDAFKIINELNKVHEIIFVSAVKGDHHKSKYNMLKTYFPEMDGFIATKEKQFVRCDMLIDDRNNFINAMPVNVITIKLNTPYTQEEELVKGTLTVESWAQLNSILPLMLV